jgi:hypothetical protein
MAKFFAKLQNSNVQAGYKLHFYQLKTALCRYLTTIGKVFAFHTFIFVNQKFKIK